MIRASIARLSRRCRLAIAALSSSALVLAASRELLEVHPSLFTRIVLAPVPWVVSLVPGHNIGTPDHPVYEGTPLHILAAFIAIPLCVAAYTMAGYLLLTLIQRRAPRVSGSAAAD